MSAYPCGADTPPPLSFYQGMVDLIKKDADKAIDDLF